jgi:competence protein ComEA
MDQAAVAGFTLLALVALAGYWLSHGGASGRLVEIDRAPRQSARFTVDINRADWPELAQIPGVGETLARRIVAAREEQGPFADHEDLRRVRGIGPRTLDRMKPFLRSMPETGSVAGP